MEWHLAVHRGAEQVHVALCLRAQLWMLYQEGQGVMNPTWDSQCLSFPVPE